MTIKIINLELELLDNSMDDTVLPILLLDFIRLTYEILNLEPVKKTIVSIVIQLGIPKEKVDFFDYAVDISISDLVNVNDSDFLMAISSRTIQKKELNIEEARKKVTT